MFCPDEFSLEALVTVVVGVFFATERLYAGCIEDLDHRFDVLLGDELSEGSEQYCFVLTDANCNRTSIVAYMGQLSDGHQR